MKKYKFKSLLCPTESVTEEQLATDRQLLAFDHTLAHLNRRGFLSAFFATAAASALAGGRPASAQTTTTAPSVVDVLNFALNLEYLEANFYSYAATGASNLSASDIGAAGVAVTGAPPMLALDAATLPVVMALAKDEKNHIETLRAAISALGGTPISQPLINLAAKGAITTQAQFLVAARQFTALGGSAYAGSAALLVSDPVSLTTAAQILGAESQHAGAVNYLCVAQAIVSVALDAYDVLPSATNYFTANISTTVTVNPVNSFSLAPARNASTVLGSAYGVSVPTTTIVALPATATSLKPGVLMGGFFPNGVNGNIKST